MRNLRIPGGVYSTYVEESTIDLHDREAFLSKREDALSSQRKRVNDPEFPYREFSHSYNGSVAGKSPHFLYVKKMYSFSSCMI